MKTVRTYGLTHLTSGMLFLIISGCIVDHPSAVNSGNIDGSGAGTNPPPATPPTTSSGSVQLTLGAPSRNTDGSPVTDLVAFKIYYGTSSGEYSNEIYLDNPGISTYVVQNLSSNIYFFAATAINGSNVESDLSNEIQRTVN